MSADNWTQCPKCRLATVDVKAELDAKYGKISREEYAKLEKSLKAAEKEQESDNLREDYEIGIFPDRNTGVPRFYVSYSGCCRKCNWSFRFKEERAVP